MESDNSFEFIVAESQAERRAKEEFSFRTKPILYLFNREPLASTLYTFIDQMGTEEEEKAKQQPTDTSKQIALDTCRFRRSSRPIKEILSITVLEAIVGTALEQVLSRSSGAEKF